jgi:hypothetical protein
MKRNSFEHVKRVVEIYYDEMVDDTIYLEGNDIDVWYIKFLCPCGCKVYVVLPLESIGGMRPHWKLQCVYPVTVSPSIRQLIGCKSHYFIENNKVKWCLNGND